MKLENYSDEELKAEVAKRNKAEAWSQEFNLRGYAWGNAFTARMYWEHPNRTEDAKQAYKWAEKEFLKIAQDFITDDEAVVGYGG